MNTKPGILGCAHLILNDACPPEPEMYLCHMGEEPEEGCKRCWENYLLYVANGRQHNPYRSNEED